MDATRGNWQQARIISTVDEVLSYGMLVWVRVGRPECCLISSPRNAIPLGVKDVYDLNALDPTGVASPYYVVDATAIELLPNFCDDPPMLHLDFSRPVVH